MFAQKKIILETEHYIHVIMYPYFHPIKSQTSGYKVI